MAGLDRPTTPAQKRIMNLMREQKLPLVMRKRDGIRTYSVGDRTVKPKTAEKLIPRLDGGGLDVECFGNVQVRRYSLPKEPSNG
jgi:hypothetical protein